MKLIQPIMDVIWPPRCLLSNNEVENSGTIASSSWINIHFIEEPWCEICGFPFELSYGQEELICLACRGLSPYYDSVRSAFVYNNFSKKLILDFKHGGKFEGLNFFAKALARVTNTLPTRPDIIIPVPLHPRRLFQRKFNQSTVLAKELSKQINLPIFFSILQRKRPTASQEGKNFSQRRANMAGAFHVTQSNPIEKAHILLVDDVFTTGATLNSCAATLKRAGAKNVSAVCLARVVKK